MRLTLWILSLVTAFLLSACGGGGGSAASTTTTTSSTASALASNVVSITVGQSISGRRPNLPYTSVTICVPNTATCQTINDVLVDTGSVGLRLMASAVTIALPLNTGTSSSQSLAECVEFADGWSWGAVRSADLKMNGESASGMAVHIIGDSAVPSTNSDCAGLGTASKNTVSDFGANGVLGIGQWVNDCGATCANAATIRTYYGCTSSGTCTSIALPLAKQVKHPGSLFASDNNGTVIVMPSITAAGTTTATGQLIFGIGTQSNNALGTATILKTDTSGEFSATYNGTTMARSILDSGSNGLFFNSSITVCAASTGASSFYCPSATLSLSATMTSNDNSAATAVSFSVENASTILSANSGGNNALPTLAGPGFASTTFDFGFPFFYGRSVYTAINGISTPGGTGPYVAF